MSLHKLAAFIFVLVIAASGLAQKREASKEVRSKLFKQVMADITELRECVAHEEGGMSAAEEGTTVEEVDLNRDGVRSMKWDSRARVRAVWSTVRSICIARVVTVTS